MAWISAAFPPPHPPPNPAPRPQTLPHAPHARCGGATTCIHAPEGRTPAGKPLLLSCFDSRRLCCSVTSRFELKEILPSFAAASFGLGGVSGILLRAGGVERWGDVRGGGS